MKPNEETAEDTASVEYINMIIKKNELSSGQISGSAVAKTDSLNCIAIFDDDCDKAKGGNAPGMTCPTKVATTVEKIVIRLAGDPELAKPRKVVWIHTCCKCGMQFNKSRKLRIHMGKHTDDRDIQRKVCCTNNQFPETSMFTQPTVDHNSEKIYKCQTCGKHFVDMEYLTLHARVHLGEQPYKCGVCGNKYKSHKTMTHHLAYRRGDWRCQCRLCGKQCHFPCHLKAHMAEHTGGKLCHCPKCEMTFVTSGQLRFHMKTHELLFPYKCKQCSNLFKSFHDLHDHIKIHLKYRCELCHQTFSNFKSLIVHGRLHSENRHYECSACYKRFAVPSILARHMLIHGKKSHVCDKCGRGFYRKDHLKRHKEMTCYAANQSKSVGPQDMIIIDDSCSPHGIMVRTKHQPRQLPPKSSNDH